MEVLEQEFDNTEVLESIYDIERLLEIIRSQEEEVEYLKDLKKYRINVIEKKVSSIDEKLVRYRQIILSTMQTLEPSKKTLPFPGIGKVTRRQTPVNWLVEDEDLLLEYLDHEGVKTEVVQTKEVIDRKRLKATLDELEKKNKDIQGVRRDPGKEIVSISFDAELDRNKKLSDVVTKDVKSKNVEPVDSLVV